VDGTHLYKVETISNEYVACAGVLNPHPEHARIAVAWAQVQRRLPLGPWWCIVRHAIMRVTRLTPPSLRARIHPLPNRRWPCRL